jgi:beta-phosphoglucomutase
MNPEHNQMGKMHYAVIFDMDGVLVDNNPFHIEAWMQFCKMKGIPVTAHEIASHFGNTNKDYLAYLLNREVSAAEAEILGNEKEIIYRKIYADSIRPLKGLLDLLDHLKQENFKIALATSAPTENVDFTIDKLGIRSYFDVLVDASLIKKGKPDPEIYHTVSRLLSMKPDHCLVFEDSVHGVEAAVRAGMKAVGVLTSASPEQLGAAKHHVVDFSQANIQWIQQLLNQTLN